MSVELTVFLVITGQLMMAGAAFASSLDSAVIVTSPQFTILDLFVYAMVITEVYDFLIWLKFYSEYGLIP